MKVRSELTHARLWIALLLFAVLPALLAYTAVTYSRPELPPGPPAYNPVPLEKTDVLSALQARELQRSRRLTTAAASIQGAQLLPATFPEPVATIVLAPRAEPYGIAELQRDLPAAFENIDGAVLLRASIEVPDGAQLSIDSATTPDLRMLSTPTGFSTIIARGGTVDIRGTKEAPIRLSSWDVDAGTPDSDPSDGRAFLLTFGGRMDLAHSDIGYLGFGTGTSSGVAWRGADHVPGQPADPALGDVTASVLHDNWFGAYTFEAQGMQWVGNTFADNQAYGFDPHDLSNDFLVADNVAHGNGRHGFIFSRGCDRNILRNNVSYDNRGHGFMIDDGRTEDSGNLQAARLPSNDNQLIGNHAYDNDGSGIEIEGGAGTVVSDNLLERNHVGVRIKNDASVAIEDNRIVDNALAGVDVLAGDGDVGITGNTIVGGWASVALAKPSSAKLTDNELRDSSAPMVVAGEAVRNEDLATTIGRIFAWNPLLVLWAAILGVPTVLGIRKLVRFIGRRRRNTRSEKTVPDSKGATSAAATDPRPGAQGPALQNAQRRGG